MKNKYYTPLVLEVHLLLKKSLHRLIALDLYIGE